MSDILLPLLMILMMFTMGLSLQKQDFIRILKVPSPMFLGLLCQLILLPIIGYGVSRIFNLSPELSLGFILICLCPGGILSNYVSYQAGADTALSISLTVFSAFITVFSIPFGLNFFQSLVGVEGQSFDLPLISTMKIIAFLTILPTLAGMGFRAAMPNAVGKVSKLLSAISSALLIGYILYIWASKADSMMASFSQVGGAVIALITFASLGAFIIAKIARLPRAQQSTIVIETGIQNITLTLMIATVLLDNAQMLIPSVFYSVVMFVPAIGLIIAGRRSKQTA